MRATAPARAVLTAALALALCPARASGAPPGPVLVPPQPIAPLRAAYPERAQGDALVVVVLTVNADGTVRAARVERGDEPFASAAVTAALSFRFAPATRDGVPVAATIKAEIKFAQPQETAAPAPVSAPASESASAPVSAPVSVPASASAPVPIEVTVHGQVAPPSASTLTRAEVRLLPGAFGDPFRAVETLPGVLPLASGIPFFYVRGAPPGNVGYFLDGIRVPLLYHIGLGPSVVHPALIERVDLYPGGYPARFGRFAGGIVAGETRPPLHEGHAYADPRAGPAVWRGEAALRLVDAGALVEAPFAGGRGSALAGGRYAYPGVLLSLVGSPVQLDYGDYQARVGYDLTSRDRISLFAFGAYDYLGERQDGETEILFDTTFHRLDLRYEHRHAPGGSLLQAVTLGYDQTRLFEGRFARTWLLGARTEIEHDAGEARVRAGADAWTEDMAADLDRGEADEDHFSSFFSTSRLDLFAGVYAEVALPITPRLEITPGLRVDFYGSLGEAAAAVDPRLAARLDVAPGVTFFQAHGLASQSPSFILPGPGFRPPLDDGLQRSFQSSAGVEVALPEDVTGKITVFRNAFFNMNDAFGSSALRGGPQGGFDRRMLGSSAGVELSVHRRLTRRVGGFVAYTLSRSTRAFGRRRIVSSFDRTHVANAAAVVDFGRGYKAGGRLLFYTGGPRAEEGPDGVQIPQGERLPPFFRLDVRLEKRWVLGRTGWISAVLEVLNATLSKEAVGVDCETGTCETVWLGPVTIPSIGVEGGF